MKKVLFISAITAFLCITLQNVKAAHTDVYKVDTKESKLIWTGKKLTGEHSGTINISGGEIHNNHGHISGNIEVDMISIESTDQKGDSKAKLEGHLKSADFFDVTTYPKAILAIKSIDPIAEVKADGHTHTVKGSLTIKNKTNDIEFNVVTKNLEQGKINYSGEVTIDRSKYDVRYGSKTFFPNIGDKIIYDDFLLKFNLVVAK